MTTIHEAYAPLHPPVRERFEGERDELRGGEFLGHSARPNLMVAGDIITSAANGDSLSEYYYDPLLKIDGAHYVRRPFGTWYSLEPLSSADAD